LQVLGLSNNELRALPLQLGDLSQPYLRFHDNPLVFPPEEITSQGQEAVLEFLRNPRPYPPYEVNAVVMGTVMAWMVSLIVTVMGWLWLLRRSAV
jgi:hypothetical protein